MDAPLWMPLVGAPRLWWLQDQLEPYEVTNNPHFHKGLIAQLVECKISTQKAVGSSSTSCIETFSNKTENPFSLQDNEGFQNNPKIPLVLLWLNPDWTQRTPKDPNLILTGPRLDPNWTPTGP